MDGATSTTTTQSTPTQGANGSEAVSQVIKQTKKQTSKQSPQQAIEDGAYPKAEQTAAEKKAYKLLKVDGQEYEVDETRYHEAAQKSFAADKRIWEANQLQKQAMQKLAEAEEKAAKYAKYDESPDLLIEDALKRLKDPNITKKARAATEKWLTEQLMAEEASPEQQRAMQLERELAEYKEREKKFEEKTKKEQQEKELQGYRQSAQESILNVLKMSALPATESMVKAIADIKYNAARAKVKLSDEQVANILKTDTIESSNALYGQFADSIIKAKQSGDVESIVKSGDALLSTLPESIIKALRIYDLAKHSQSRGQAMKKEEPVIQEEPKKTSGAYDMSWEEFQEYEKKRMSS